MCREGAWAELAAGVTFMMWIQSRMPGYKTKDILTSYEVRIFCRIGNFVSYTTKASGRMRSSRRRRLPNGTARARRMRKAHSFLLRFFVEIV